MEELEQFDGVKKSEIYIAIKDNVYDVTKGKVFYGPEGSYGVFGGRDATYGLAKGEVVIKEGVYELTDEELKTLEEWETLFKNKYKHIGILKK